MGVWAVDKGMGSKLTGSAAADMPADVAERVCGANLAAPGIAYGACIVEGEVERMGCREANGSRGVGSRAHGRTGSTWGE